MYALRELVPCFEEGLVEVDLLLGGGDARGSLDRRGHVFVGRAVLDHNLDPASPSNPLSANVRASTPTPPQPAPEDPCPAEKYAPGKETKIERPNPDRATNRQARPRVPNAPQSTRARAQARKKPREKVCV